MTASPPLPQAELEAMIIGALTFAMSPAARSLHDDRCRIAESGPVAVSVTRATDMALLEVWLLGAGRVAAFRLLDQGARYEVVELQMPHLSQWLPIVEFEAAALPDVTH